MIAYVVAVILLTATPGPGVLSVAGVGAGFGWKAGVRFLGGVFLGTNAVACLAASGLGAVVLAEPRLRLVLTFVSVAYLGYLAVRVALSGESMAPTRHERPPGMAEGVVLQVVNPKCYAVNLSLFSGFPLAGLSVGPEIALKFLILNAIWVPVHFGWLAAGAAVARLDLSPGAKRALNLGMAATMLAAVAVALLAG